MRLSAALLLLATLLPVTVYAAVCREPQLLTRVKMLPSPDGIDSISAGVNGEKRLFVFDSGGYYTQIGRQFAQQLKLQRLQGHFQLFDSQGNVTRDYVHVRELTVGNLRGTDMYLPVAATDGPDGVIALDHLTKMDMEWDFNGETVSFYSQDHCDGRIPAWTSPANVTSVPFTLEGSHIVVKVTLDGVGERALIDTGSAETSLMKDEASRSGLTLGSDDTPEKGMLNGDPRTRYYTHRFKNLSIGNILVSSPEILVRPNLVGRSADRNELVTDRTKTEKDLISKQDMGIGMDVLRKLHLFIAFREHRLYMSSVSPSASMASQSAPGATP